MQPLRKPRFSRAGVGLLALGLGTTKDEKEAAPHHVPPGSQQKAALHKQEKRPHHKQPHWLLGLGTSSNVKSSRTARTSISILEVTQSLVPCCSRPRRLIENLIKKNVTKCHLEYASLSWPWPVEMTVCRRRKMGMKGPWHIKKKTSLNTQPTVTPGVTAPPH